MGESRAEVEAETVERVARLVTTAGATLKEKKRPIKVVARDGTIKKVVPHVEVIEGLLHHEGISGELQAGVRPKTILCAVCKCVVKVKPGALPKRCKKHRNRKLCPRGCGTAVKRDSPSCVACKTPEERSAAVREWIARSTPEQRSDVVRKAQAGIPHERRVEIAKKRQASKAAGQRSEVMRKVSQRKTFEQRSEGAKKANAAQSAEQRSERQRKAWETRRAKAAAEKAGEK